MRDGATSPLRMKSLLSTQMTVPSSTIFRACRLRAQPLKRRDASFNRARAKAAPPARRKQPRQRERARCASAAQMRARLARGAAPRQRVAAPTQSPERRNRTRVHAAPRTRLHADGLGRRLGTGRAPPAIVRRKRPGQQAGRASRFARLPVQRRFRAFAAPQPARRGAAWATPRRALWRRQPRRLQSLGSVECPAALRPPPPPHGRPSGRRCWSRPRRCALNALPPRLQALVSELARLLTLPKRGGKALIRRRSRRRPLLLTWRR
jgi:hypothetical protein